MKIVRKYEPDLAAQARALRLLLGRYTPGPQTDAVGPANHDSSVLEESVCNNDTLSRAISGRRNEKTPVMPGSETGAYQVGQNHTQCDFLRRRT